MFFFNFIPWHPWGGEQTGLKIWIWYVCTLYEEKGCINWIFTCMFYLFKLTYNEFLVYVNLDRAHSSVHKIII